MRGCTRNGVARLREQAFQQREANVNWTEEVQHGPEERYLNKVAMNPQWRGSECSEESLKKLLKSWKLKSIRSALLL